MHMLWSRTALATLLAATPVFVGALQVSYTRAEQLLDWNTTLLVSGDEVRPQWLLDGARFYYRNKTATEEFVAETVAGAEYLKGICREIGIRVE